MKCFLGLGSDFSAHQGVLTDHPHTAERLGELGCLGLWTTELSVLCCLMSKRIQEQRSPAHLEVADRTVLGIVLSSHSQQD